jgi:hypothetical protein
MRCLNFLTTFLTLFFCTINITAQEEIKIGENKSLEGEWQPDCNNPEESFIIKGDSVNFDLIVYNAGIMEVVLSMKWISDSEIYLYFNRIKNIYFPLGDERYSDFCISDSVLSSEIPVGKLTVLSEISIEFDWYGVKHIPFDVLLFKNLHYSANSEGKIVLNVCK